MADAPQRVNAVVGATEDQINYDPRTNSVAGQMITWVFIPLIGLSAMFAMERTGGTLRRLLVTPTSKAVYIGGTVIGQVLTALLQMALLITFGVLVLQIDWGQSPLALGLVMLTSALAAASLGTMLGTIVKTEGQANGLSIMIGMVMAMMGGCWYPIELFPQAIRTAAQVLPTYWAMSGFLDIAVRGQGVSGILLESGILLGFALVFFLIGVWRFKFE
jgi:ABC-2 type transport system permease protein